MVSLFGNPTDIFAERAKNGFKGRKFFARERISPPAREHPAPKRSLVRDKLRRAEKLPLHFFFWEVRQFFCEAQPPQSGDWRRVSVGFASWICVLGLVK